MMVVVRRLQEIGQKAEVSLFMCVIDLQKAYDTATSCGRYSLASEYHRRY